ncbi:MAG: cytochrome c [Chitinophagales bacterium]|nr:cytochrome c [Chitinophagales bacterium]
MKLILRILAGIALLLIVLVFYVFLAWNKKYDAPYPEIQSSSDSAIIARGKYLAFGPAHCVTCHVPMDKIMEVENGLEIPLSGGWELAFPGFGVFRAPNITPDGETGIGKLSDGEIARTLRHAVGSDGRVIMPFMPFQEMSDDDLAAIISFLRSQEPVKNAVKPTEYDFMAKALLAFGILKPEGAKNTPPKTMLKDSTAEYGKYLAFNIANCRGCHTKMDPNTGKFVGEDFAGGEKFGPDAFSEGYVFVSPNITSDKTTSAIAKWTEDAFVARFGAGRIHKTTPMPWGAFSRMDETDLKALYRFLQTTKPVANKIEKTVYAPDEKAPK